MRDLGGPREGQVGAGRDRRPSDDLVTVIGQHTGLGAPAGQRLDEVGPLLSTRETLSFAGIRWLRHQQTLEAGFLGPTIVRRSSKRARVAGWTVSPRDVTRGVVAMSATLDPGTDGTCSMGAWLR